MQNSRKPWQVQVQGQIYEAELEELRQWIIEGSVASSDNVRRGDLRWLPAEKVPALYNCFTSTAALRRASPAIFAGDFPPAVKLSDRPAFSITQTDADTPSVVFSGVHTGEREFVDTAAANAGAVEKDANFCYWHETSPTEYACDICENFFCKTCPKSFGGSVKLCPLCGSMCRKTDEAVDLQKVIGAIHKPYTQADETEAENQSPKQHSPQIPGFWKSLAGSSRYYKTLLRETPVSRFFSRPDKEL